jgi:hypothetical protein
LQLFRLPTFPTANFSVCQLFRLPTFPLANFSDCQLSDYQLSDCQLFRLPTFPIANFPISNFSDCQLFRLQLFRLPQKKKVNHMTLFIFVCCIIVPADRISTTTMPEIRRFECGMCRAGPQYCAEFVAKDPNVVSFVLKRMCSLTSRFRSLSTCRPSVIVDTCSDTTHWLFQCLSPSRLQCFVRKDTARSMAAQSSKQ